MNTPRATILAVLKLRFNAVSAATNGHFPGLYSARFDPFFLAP
jgi:hypothetical protein